MTDATALSAGRPGVRVGGRYRLEALVGRGGSAEVWSAQDEALERPVAVKLVTATGGEDAGRVRDEARLLARLSHPGLVPVYDAGTDEGGRPWVVMELVVGETLADAIARGALPPERTAEIGRVLADALAYVHGQGLVHRDVKPANVLLGRDGRVRLTDFGIARLVDAARVTATGLTVGTASYLSPEQVTGAEVGPPSDVYSLGLVLLECLTGRREYPGSAVEVALARLTRPPRVPPHLPQGWTGLLEAMTAREPAPRPTAALVSAELGRIVAGGQATTALVAAAPPVDTQLIDRTALLDRTAALDRTRLDRTHDVTRPAPPAPGRPTAPRRPATAPRPARRRSGGWAWVLLLLSLVTAVVLSLVAYQRLTSASVPSLPSISEQLPDRLERDLERLQDLQREVTR